MKKMKKAGVLVSAIATTAVCASMIAGSTFALFTSEDQVDITVKAGSVEVSSSIENAQIKHATSIEKNGEEYAVSYTDAVVEEVTVSGNELALTNVIPGDIMEFDIVLSNDGTVDANYQYSLKCTEGLKLISALDVEIVNGETFVYSGSGLKSYQSKWDELNVNAEETYHVTMTLPAEAGNEYKGLTSKLVVGTYAVQYNAVVDKTAEAVIETVPEEATVIDINATDDYLKALQTNNVYAILNNNITCGPVGANIEGKNVIVDLNGKTLTTNFAETAEIVSINVGNNSEVTYKNGNYIVNGGNKYKQYNNDNYVGVQVNQPLSVSGNGCLTLDSVYFEGYGGVFVDAAAGHLVVKNSTMKIYDPMQQAIGTNNKTNYAPVIEVYGTTIESVGTGILSNIPDGKLTVDNCNITAGLIGLYVRGGEATIKNGTKITCKASAEYWEKLFTEGAWKDGGATAIKGLYNYTNKLFAEGFDSAKGYNWQNGTSGAPSCIALGSYKNGAYGAVVCNIAEDTEFNVTDTSGLVHTIVIGQRPDNKPITVNYPNAINDIVKLEVEGSECVVTINK